MNALQIKDAIERIKTLTPLLPDPVIQKATETGLDLLAGALDVVQAKGLTVEEYRDALAQHLSENWQGALESKFGGHVPGDHDPET
jgi:hypothetical protein